MIWLTYSMFRHYKGPNSKIKEDITKEESITKSDHQP